jgi:hypothetical protein
VRPVLDWVYLSAENAQHEICGEEFSGIGCDSPKDEGSKRPKTGQPLRMPRPDLSTATLKLWNFFQHCVSGVTVTASGSFRKPQTTAILKSLRSCGGEYREGILRWSRSRPTSYSREAGRLLFAWHRATGTAELQHKSFICLIGFTAHGSGFSLP